MKKIISASRRTDIPRFFGKWFVQRRKAGFAEFRNAFGGHGWVSLRNDDVLGYLFWTKYSQPFAPALKALKDEGIPYVFQYTINGYGRDFELHIPKVERVIDDFLEVRRGLPSSQSIQWRYDPIILSNNYDKEFHLKNFEEIARHLKGATEVVNISFVEPYLKTVRRIDDTTVLFRKIDPNRHKSVYKRYPNLLQLDEDIQAFIHSLQEIAAKYHLQLRSCANPELSLINARCCGAEMFAPYGTTVTEEIRVFKQRPSRTACHCLESVDIGMDNTCTGGCIYCYVVTSLKSALQNYRNHDPLATCLRK